MKKLAILVMTAMVLLVSCNKTVAPRRIDGMQRVVQEQWLQ